MKGYPKGWKPPKEKKYHKAPTPPPGHDHGDAKKYDRSFRRDRYHDIIEGLEDYEKERK